MPQNETRRYPLGLSDRIQRRFSTTPEPWCRGKAIDRDERSIPFILDNLRSSPFQFFSIWNYKAGT